MATLNMPASTDELNIERIRFAELATSIAEPVYREPMRFLYEQWESFNRSYFAEQLRLPHLTFGQTGPRALAFCQQTTDWGFELQITFRRSLILGSHRAIVNPWPAEGTSRFLSDILLHEVVHQHQFEVSGHHESSYGGHGRQFAQVCNRIGAQLDLLPVIARARGEKDREKPVCAHWPCNVRPEGYYLDDVVEQHTLVRGVKRANSNSCRIQKNVELLLLCETILGMLEEGRIEETKEVLRRELSGEVTHEQA